jgi:hypothetical protein
VPESSKWTPYAHEDLRVHLLWRKRILVGLVLASLFLVWALSLGVTTQTTEELSVYGGDGQSTTIQRPDEENQGTQPDATVSVSPGETARLEDGVQVGNETPPERQGGGTPTPEPPDGIPFLGLLMLLGPFIAAVYAWRKLANQGDVGEANYGIYKGPMPLEKVTATHADLVQTGQEVEENPFGKRRNDYLRDAAGRYRGFADVEPPYTDD